MPHITQNDVNKEVEKHFPSWFKTYVSFDCKLQHVPYKFFISINIFVMQASQNPIENNFISDVVKGPLHTVKSYPVYFINGFKYHTQSHGNNKATTNSGVCIKGELMDYYGKIT